MMRSLRIHGTVAMRSVSPTLHRGIDFATIAVFALAPSLLRFTGVPMRLAYFLALVHLLLTLTTRFTPAPRPLPLWVHTAVEGFVGVVLIALAWGLNWQGAPLAFYTGVGVVILILAVLTALREPAVEAR